MFSCLFRHKWEYKKEDLTYTSSATSKKMVIGTSVRVCKVCYKKQVNHGSGWIHWNYLSKEELRDKKLNQLGL